MLMDQEFIKRPSQIEADVREGLMQKTAEPPSYNESDLIHDDNELIDDEHEFDVDELDADFEYGP
jgi:hypothetical protein